MTRTFALHAAAALAVFASLAIAWELRGVVVMFLASLALAAAMRPGYETLVEARLPRAMAIGLAFVLGVAIAFGLGLVAVSELARESDLLAKAFQTVVDRRQELPAWLQSYVGWLTPPPAVDPEAQRDLVVERTLEITAGLVEWGASLLLVVAMSVYWAMDHRRLERLWLALIPGSLRTRTRETWRAVEVELGRYLRTEMVLSLCTGLAMWLGLSALGHPYAALLASVAATAWFMPWTGPLFTLLATVALSIVAEWTGDARAWITPMAVVYTLMLTLVVEGVVEPRLFDRGRYNSLMVAIVSFGLAATHGPIWLLVGPPLAYLLQIVFVEFSLTNRATTVTPLRDRVAALRRTLVEVADIDAAASPELQSLVARLESLVEAHHELEPDDEEAPLGLVAR